MALITGKTVYVLGAGASFHTGAPLLNDFLVSARMLSESRNDLVYGDSFERIFDWIDGLRGSSYYLDFDLDNLEHIFSLADMSRQLGLKNGDTHFSDLRNIIMETIDQKCQLERRKSGLVPDRMYNVFFETLKSINQDRSRRLSNRGRIPFEQDVIISFNYDLMLDHAIELSGEGVDYSFGSGSGGFKLLKLHGSMNWARCAKCNVQPQVIKLSPLGRGSLMFINNETVSFTVATEVMKKTKCEGCKETGTLEPIIIPPTWSKAVKDKELLANVWRTAVNELKDANQIIVIGYSMPVTDTFFQYLLTLGLEKNSKLNKVIVINPDNSGELEERYKKIFSRSLMERGRLKFEDETFKDAVVSGTLKKLGSHL